MIIYYRIKNKTKTLNTQIVGMVTKSCERILSYYLLFVVLLYQELVVIYNQYEYEYFVRQDLDKKSQKFYFIYLY